MKIPAYMAKSTASLHGKVARMVRDSECMGELLIPGQLASAARMIGERYAPASVKPSGSGLAWTVMYAQSCSLSYC
jgi:hypothetical protein